MSRPLDSVKLALEGSHLEVNVDHPPSPGGRGLSSRRSLRAVSPPAKADGGLMGWVESTRGMPVAGAVVSVFGKGIGSGGVVTLTDSAGQFVLPALPAGSYTLRALGSGHVPAPAREDHGPARPRLHLHGQPDSGRGSATGGIGSEAAATAPADRRSVREWEWLSATAAARFSRPARTALVVEDPPPAAIALAARGPWIPQLGGSVELVTSPAVLGWTRNRSGTLRASQGALRLHGRLAETGRWSLGGLVTEAENRTWRMGAEFVLEPGGGHKIQTGAGYGMNYLRSPSALATDVDALGSRSVGAAFFKDRFPLGRRGFATVGARYAYLGFLDDRNHVDTMIALELRDDSNAWLRGSVASRTLAPGGDLLTLSTLETSPVTSYARLQAGLRPSRTWRYELAVDRVLGAAKFGAHVFYEDTADQLVNVFEGIRRLAPCTC